MFDSVLLLFTKVNDLNETRNLYFFREIDDWRTFIWHENAVF